MPGPMPYAFSRYRDFVVAWFEFWRRGGERVTLESFATLAGCSASYVHKVRGGKTALLPRFVAGFARAMQLDARGARQLGLLVELEHGPPACRERVVAALAAGRIEALGAALSPDHPGALRLLAVMVAEVLRVPGAPTDAEVLSTWFQVPIAPSTIALVLDALSKVGLATRPQDPEAQDIRARVLDLVASAMHSMPARDRPFRTILWLTTPAAAEAVRARLARLRGDLASLQDARGDRLLLAYDLELVFPFGQAPARRGPPPMPDVGHGESPPPS